MSEPVKVPYKPPVLHVYGTLRELTRVAGASGADNPTAPPSAGNHTTRSPH